MAVSFHVDAAPSQVWHVIGTRWGEAHLFMPTVQRSRLITPLGPGVGARRECTLNSPIDKTPQVVERLVAWDPRRSLTYVLDDPPGALRAVRTTWSVEAEGQGTRVTYQIHVKMSGLFGWAKPAAAMRLRRRFAKNLPELSRSLRREALLVPRQRRPGTKTA